MEFLSAFALAGPALAVVVLAGTDCPRGAMHVATLAGLPGARAVAFDGEDLLVCVPEAADPARRVVRIPGARADGSAKPLGIRVEAPVDLAVGPSGAAAVADAGARCVWVLGSASSSTGTPGDGGRSFGADVLEEPSGVAFRGEELLVADRALRAICVFGPDGSERREHRLGQGVLGDPRSLCVLADGSVAVADRLHDCLFVFPSDGGEVRDEPRRIGELGPNPGQFSAPTDVAVLRRSGGDRSLDCILVSDELNHRVVVLDAQTGFVGFFGMHALVPRLGDGQIHYPASIAVAPDGTRVAVAEAFEDRVQILALTPEPDPMQIPSSPEFISSHFGPDAGGGSGLLAFTDVETEAVAVLDARQTPPIHISVVGGSGALPQRFREISALAIEPDAPRIWIADRGRNRIDVVQIRWDPTKDPVVDQFLPALARSMDLAAFATRIDGSGGRSPGRIPDVVDVAFAGAAPSDVILLDAANRALIRTDRRLSRGVVEFLPEAAIGPSEIAVASDGRLAVADPLAGRVFLRSPGGEWSDSSSLGPVALVRPSGVAFDAHGRLLVTDAALDLLLVVGSDGGVRVVGERGGLDEQFWEPQSIVDSPLGLVVVDRGNHRFQRFGDGVVWNLTSSLGRYYERKRRGSPGAAPAAGEGGDQ